MPCNSCSWNAEPPRDDNIKLAPSHIHHAEGDITVRINQQEEPAHERLFRALGTFRFEAGRGRWVRVSNDGTETSKVVIADAVQFLPVDKPTR